MSIGLHHPRVLGKAYGGANTPGYIIQRHYLGDDDHIEITVMRKNSEAHDWVIGHPIIVSPPSGNGELINELYFSLTSH